MKRIYIFVVGLAVAGCVSSGESPELLGGFRVTFRDEPDRGTPDKPLPFSADLMSFNIRVEALFPDGERDAGYDGWVVVDVRPTGKINSEDPQVVRLKAGAGNATVKFSKAFGAVRLVVVEEGYVPDDNIASATCGNGKKKDGQWRSGDDDHDGYVDFPNDRGCYYSTDSDEEGGSGAAGASPPIYFANPRIEDVQRPNPLGKNKDVSRLLGVRVEIDRGFMLVHRVGIDGLYVTDFDGVSWDGSNFTVEPDKLSYRSIFAFNFSTPMNLQEGDCLTSLSGTVEEFHDFTELGKPTWKKGDPVFCGNLAYRASNNQLSDCAPPKDGEDDKALKERQKGCRLELEKLANRTFDITRMKIDTEDGEKSVWDQRYLQTERFESALVQISDVEISEVTVFTELRECDRNDNGIIDFYDDQESDCAKDCGKTPGCVVAETYRRYNQWAVTFTDHLGDVRELSVVTIGAIPKFNPINAKGRKLSTIVGTLRHLGFADPPWILEPRRPADCPDCISD